MRRSLRKLTQWLSGTSADGHRTLPPDEIRRRRREVIAIALTGILVLVFAGFERRLPEFSNSLSPSGNVIFFLLINLNLILLILLIFLVTRNLVKLIFERRRRILGSRLRTRLVLAFVGLSLFPTLLLFLVAQGFLTATIGNWFSGQVEQSLSDSLHVTHGYYQQAANNSLHDARELSQRIRLRDLLAGSRRDQLQRFVEAKRAELNVSGIEVLIDGESVARARAADLKGEVPAPSAADLDGIMTGGQEFARTLDLRHGEVVRSGVPVTGRDGAVRGVVIVDAFVPRSVSEAAQGVARAYQEYHQLSVLEQPLKNGYTLSFLLITLVVIFSATWFGFHLAKGITGPIQRLGEGMRAVAQGNWDYRAEPEGDEEVATLVDSFNQMTTELKVIHSALEERRRYIESVLANIAAGVVSIDADGSVMTVNPAAAAMLDLRTEEVCGRQWREVFRQANLRPVGEIVEHLGTGDAQKVERQIQLASGARMLTVWVTVTTLADESRERRGIILFFEDVTYLLRVERMEAWREVARRIAHEIKNPLTPIQLSAQRLRKGYGDGSTERDRALLDECTRTIVGQVEQLKRLVNEFSTFARLPAAQVAPDDLNRVVEDALVLFRQGHPDIVFDFRPDPALPPVEVDRDAIKRAVINLLDNAVAACQIAARSDARVEIVTAHDARVGVVRLEVADNGCGMTPDIKARAFEPYFSTKKDGTGLGLAIVSAIAADHQAYVRIRDNPPRGTRMIIEFPTRRSRVLSAVARA